MSNIKDTFAESLQLQMSVCASMYQNSENGSFCEELFSKNDF